MINNGSALSSKNTKMSFGFRERFSKFSKQKNLKIQVNNLNDNIKKPAPIAQDNMANFIGTSPAYQSDIRNLQSSTPNNKSKELPVPFVFSSGQTPELKQICPTNTSNVFNFESARSPNPFAPFGYSPNRRPETGFSVYDSHSPYRPNFLFAKQAALSPAFIFDPSYRRQGN
mmetsp:Transcript_10410/g.11875  ORF Transcript_10410/g.11875 Transcript_10410/m.11875 type:complete len:172 (+) Transcript_10410:505-1020(+)